jgi:hypothetical protein
MTITDVLGAVISAEGILAALLARARTGVGVRAETALVDAALLIRDSATTLTDRITLSEAVTGTAGSAAAVVTDLAAMAADPAYSAALDIGDAVTYSGAPWTFAPPASKHSREVTTP